MKNIKIVLLITSVTFGLAFFIKIYNNKNIKVVIADKIEIEFGKQLPENFTKSHDIHSVFTDKNSNDDLLIYPNDSTLIYKYLRIMTVNDKVASLHIYLKQNKPINVELIIKTYHETRIINFEEIENKNHNELYKMIYYGINSNNKLVKINIINVAKFSNHTNYYF